MFVLVRESISFFLNFIIILMAVHLILKSIYANLKFLEARCRKGNCCCFVLCFVCLFVCICLHIYVCECPEMDGKF